MQARLSLFIAATLLAGCAGAPPPPATQASPSAPAAVPSANEVPSVSAHQGAAVDPRGARVVDALVRADWASVQAMFAPELRTAVSSATIRAIWNQSTAKSGAFREIAASRGWTDTRGEMLVTTARFENGLIDVSTRFAEPGGTEIVGFIPLPADASARALALLVPFAHGDVDAIYAHLDDEARRGLSRERFAEMWGTTIATFGEFDHFEGAKTTADAAHETVTVTTAFAHEPARVALVFHTGTDRLSGFAVNATQASAPPPYAKPDSYDEKEVTVGDGDRALPATLTMPKGKGPFPAVILVHGSGPADRDEAFEALRPFRDIAWGLASRGIVVLRYEKRTYGKNLATIAAAMPHLTIQDETVDDALAALRTLRSAERVDKKHVYVVGHSLGAMMAPLIAETDKSVNGIVLLAGPARPFEDVFLQQVTNRLASQGDKGAAMIDTVRKQVARAKSADLTPDTPISELPLNLAGSYWLSLRGYDPVARAKKLAKPILVLRGQNDTQVFHEDFVLWSAALGKSRFATLAELPGLTHFFVEGAPDVPAYVREDVVAKIGDWVLARK